MDVYINSENANTISREHSLVEFINGRMYISNLSKTNPTFLNHDKVNDFIFSIHISDLVI